MLNEGLLIVEQSKLCHGLDYLTKFNAKRYLKTYFDDLNPNEFDGDLVPFQLETLFYIFNRALKDQLDKRSARLLDVGAGPSVQVALAASKAFRDIYLADLVDGNRYELRKWLEYGADAFDWTEVAKFIGNMERVHDEVVVERAREKIKDVLECNVHDRKVIRESLGQFEAVSSVFCLETACENYRQFERGLLHLGDLVKPGGYLVLAGMLNNLYYDAGGCVFRTLVLTKRDILASLDYCGLDLEEWFEFQLPFTETNKPRASLNATHYVCYARKRQVDT